MTVSSFTSETRKTTDKVLYIDDSPDRIELIQLIFEHKRNDIELQILSGIQEGIKITRQELPTLIIICSYVSDGNAWEFLYQVEDDGALLNIPIVALGGRFDHWKGDPPQVSPNSPQPNVVLPMPFHVDELLQAVEQYLPEPS
ncbi:hypothetical protein ACFLXQ_06500 [Chloroflexota bacterium]